MKKTWLALALILAMAATLLAGCGDSSTPATSSGSDPAPASSAPPPASAAPSLAPAAPADTSAAPTENLPDKDTIVIGMARPISGVYEVFETDVFGPIYRMWVEDVNADGGIYVAEYGKKLPIELKVYDDTSDMDTMIRLTERLMLEDKVDFIFPSCSTAFLFAQAAVTSNHGYLLFSAEGGAAELATLYDRLPLFFCTANHSVTQVPAMAAMLAEQGITSAYITFINDQHGIEYSAAAGPALAGYGIDILGMKALPPDIDDMTTILNDAKSSGAQAFLQFAYPDQNFLAVGQAMAVGFDPDVFLLGPGGNMDVIQWIFGPAADGIMGFGGWNAKSSPAAAAFVDKFYSTNPGVGIDWWGHICYQAVLQVFQQAVEGAGTLDNAKVAEYMQTHTFETVMGTIWYENNSIAAECYLGNVGQWQNGVFEVLDVDPGRRTATPIVPKPSWPAE